MQGPPEKKRRMESDEGSLNSVSWKHRLLRAYVAVAGPLVEQTRPLILESICTGMATHSVGLRDSLG